MSLLNKAKMIRDGRYFKPSEEVILVAIAWAKGEITSSQAVIALSDKNTKSSNGYIKLACAFRELVKTGRIVV